MQVSDKDDQDFSSHLAPIAERISKITGIQLGAKQRTQVRSRISQRMRKLGIASEKGYAEYFSKNIVEESDELVSLLTTHYTFFFREFAHFEFLIEVLPKLVEKAKAEGRRTLKIWSAAGSTGQEAYSIAMALAVHLPKIDPTMKFEVLGSDVDPKSVQHASNGVYRWGELKTAPSVYIEGNWARGTGDISAFVKVKESLKKCTRFEVRNLIDLPVNSQNEKFDFIFCRNVFIYFPKNHIEQVVKSLLQRLVPHGYLASGLSESLNDIDVPLTMLGSSIYARQTAESSKKNSVPEKVTKLSPAVRSIPKKPVKVLVVDDSHSILLIMKKVLSETAGFEVVGTATNGLEAAEFLKSNKVDVVTLDIHMPEQNGVEYLQASYGPNHPPVVIVSSVSREDSGLAIRALNLGAFDYIEKPSLGNLKEIESEICSKVKFAASYAEFKPKMSHSLDKQFSEKICIVNPESKFRNLYASISDLEHVVNVLKSSKGKQPPTILYFSFTGNLLTDLIAQIQTKLSTSIVEMGATNVGSLQLGKVYVDDIKNIEKNWVGRSSCVSSNLVFAGVSVESFSKIRNIHSGSIVLEDVGEASAVLKAKLSIDDVFAPVTSFAYESDKFLARLSNKRSA